MTISKHAYTKPQTRVPQMLNRSFLKKILAKSYILNSFPITCIKFGVTLFKLTSYQNSRKYLFTKRFSTFFYCAYTHFYLPCFLIWELFQDTFPQFKAQSLSYKSGNNRMRVSTKNLDVWHDFRLRITTIPWEILTVFFTALHRTCARLRTTRSTTGNALQIHGFQNVWERGAQTLAVYLCHLHFRYCHRVRGCLLGKWNVRTGY